MTAPPKYLSIVTSQGAGLTITAQFVVLVNGVWTPAGSPFVLPAGADLGAGVYAYAPVYPAVFLAAGGGAVTYTDDGGSVVTEAQTVLFDPVTPPQPPSGAGYDAATSTQYFDETLLTADAQVYTGPWTVRVEQGGASWPGPGDSTSGVTADVQPDGEPTTQADIAIGGLPYPLAGFMTGPATARLTNAAGAVLSVAIVITGAGSPAASDPATTTDPGTDPDTGNGAQDISLALSAPLTSLLPPARVLMAPDQPGSFVHVLVSLTANDGGSAGDSLASSLTNTPPRLALVRGYAEDGDFQDGSWLEQTSGDTPLTYARLDAATLPLVSGCAYFVYVQVTAGGQTITRRAPGEIIVC